MITSCCIHQDGPPCDHLLNDPLAILADPTNWPTHLCPEVAYASNLQWAEERAQRLYGDDVPAEVADWSTMYPLPVGRWSLPAGVPEVLAVLPSRGKSKAALRTIRLTLGTVAELRTDRKRWAALKLEAGPMWNPDALLFTTRSGKPLSSNNLRRSFDALVANADVPAITPHAIRKTAITLALANGASPKAVANRVGHADSRVTLDIYSSITESMDDALLDIITGIVPQGDGGKTA